MKKNFIKSFGELEAALQIIRIMILQSFYVEGSQILMSKTLKLEKVMGLETLLALTSESISISSESLIGNQFDDLSFNVEQLGQLLDQLK